MWCTSRLDTVTAFFSNPHNDLHLAIKYCEVHNYADDVNVLNFNNSVKSIKKQVQGKFISLLIKMISCVLHQLKNKLIVIWKLNSIEKSSIKSNTWELKWNKGFIWKQQVNHVAIKLNKVIAMLTKLLCNLWIIFMLCFTCLGSEH